MKNGLFISAITYDKKGNPLCHRCGSRLADLEKRKGFRELGLHDWKCPHCDDKFCGKCGGPLVYSSTLGTFLCMNDDCPECCFKWVE